MPRPDLYVCVCGNVSSYRPKFGSVPVPAETKTGSEILALVLAMLTISIPVEI